MGNELPTPLPAVTNITVRKDSDCFIFKFIMDTISQKKPWHGGPGAADSLESAFHTGSRT